jgi:hypothetical protein
MKRLWTILIGIRQRNLRKDFLRDGNVKVVKVVEEVNVQEVDVQVVDVQEVDVQAGAARVQADAARVQADAARVHVLADAARVQILADATHSAVVQAVEVQAVEVQAVEVQAVEVQAVEVQAVVVPALEVKAVEVQAAVKVTVVVVACVMAFVDATSVTGMISDGSHQAKEVGRVANHLVVLLKLRHTSIERTHTSIGRRILKSLMMIIELKVSNTLNN